MKCCVSTDVGTWTNWLTFDFETDPDYSSDAGTGSLSLISYKRCNAEFYYVWKIPRIRIGRPSLQQCVILKWFYSLRAVGTTLLESALLVVIITVFILLCMCADTTVLLLCWMIGCLWNKKFTYNSLWPLVWLLEGHSRLSLMVLFSRLQSHMPSS